MRIELSCKLMGEKIPIKNHIDILEKYYEVTATSRLMESDDLLGPKFHVFLRLKPKKEKLVDEDDANG